MVGMNNDRIFTIPWQRRWNRFGDRIAEPLATDRQMYWKTKDGRKFWIPDMEDKHLVNTVKYLEREYTTDLVKDWQIYKNLVNELNKRGINANKEWDD